MDCLKKRINLQGGTGREPELVLELDYNATDDGPWVPVFDVSYHQMKIRNDPATACWRNSINGEQFVIEEMNEWLDGTIEKLSPYLTPSSRVLEIGCGNGLIFERIIKDVEFYCGLDPSKAALELLKESPNYVEFSAKISLINEEFHNVVNRLKGFDLVILNSTAQYFHGLKYLSALVADLENVLKREGVIFIGDLRSYQHFDGYCEYLSQERKKLGVKTEYKIDPQLIRESEKECLYSPSIFSMFPIFFPWIESSLPTMKVGRYDNEMNRFRYDVVMKSAGSSAKTCEIKYVDCGGRKFDDTLVEGDESFIMVNVQNPRIASRRCQEEELDDLQRIQKKFQTAFDPMCSSMMIVATIDVSMEVVHEQLLRRAVQKMQQTHATQDVLMLNEIYCNKP